MVAPYHQNFFGQEAPPPSPVPQPPLAPPGEDQLAMLIEKKDGQNHFRPGVAQEIMKMLATMRYEFIGGGLPGATLVRIVPFTDAELAAASSSTEYQKALDFVNAKKWVDQQVSLGKVVLAPWWITAPIPERYLTALPASEKDQIRQATSVPYMAILAAPGGMTVAGLSVTTLAIGAVVVLGAAALIGSRIRRRGSVKEAFTFR